jgi:5-methylcytosine-specific restriction enzyme subunit McrC
MARYASEEFPDTLHLFSRQLIAGIRVLHHRGFETGYLSLEESTGAPRGRILIAPSIRTMTTNPARLYCTFDEMSADIQSNQILKATLKRLLQVTSFEAPVRRDLRQTFNLLREVREVDLSARAFHVGKNRVSKRLPHSFITEGL